MTREEVLAMPAGPELDALVAERVMGQSLDWEHAHVRRWGPPEVSGWHAYRCASCGAQWSNGQPIPRCTAPSDRRYSQEIAAAWEVADKYGMAVAKFGVGAWVAMAGYQDESDGTRSQYDHEVWMGGSDGADGETAALAICRAAILATLDVE